MLLVGRPHFEDHWLNNLASAQIVLVKFLLDVTKDLQWPSPVISFSLLILLDPFAAFHTTDGFLTGLPAAGLTFFQSTDYTEHHDTVQNTNTILSLST